MAQPVMAAPMVTQPVLAPVVAAPVVAQPAVVSVAAPVAASVAAPMAAPMAATAGPPTAALDFGLFDVIFPFWISAFVFCVSCKTEVHWHKWERWFSHPQNSKSNSN